MGLQEQCEALMYLDERSFGPRFFAPSDAQRLAVLAQPPWLIRTGVSSQGEGLVRAEPGHRFEQALPSQRLLVAAFEEDGSNGVKLLYILWGEFSTVPNVF
ncbi:hypothetical protein SDC9_195573 [bioreactor metagenome]|uniref:Uncharacterized protein n=1 Tax=bioreactor metagenome TaxID=1076179 RepID=A0A645IBX6_9ZZZZ